MFRALARDFRSAPVTFSLIVVSVVLFVAVELHKSHSDESLSGLPALGAIVELKYQDESSVHGPFDLWDGPWWRWLRIPVSAFHHVNLLHLVCNASSLWYFGPLLERRLKRVRYLAFWFFSAIVPFVLEYYLGHCPIGLSGVACALFGWCLYVRQFDSVVADRVHEGVVRSTWFFLFGCIVATAAGLINIANVAHFAGVGYGWLNARSSRTRTGRTMWVVGHLLLPFAIFGVLHPVWDSQFQVFAGRMAMQKANDPSAGVPHFQKAIQLNPALPQAWEWLAHERTLHGDSLAAWKLAAEGLHHNRSDDRLEEQARSIWSHVPISKRTDALAWFDKLFAPDAAFWKERLQLTASQGRSKPTRSEQTEADQLKSLFREESPEKSNDVGTGSRRGRKLRQPNVNPDDSNSASEGRSL